MKPATPSTLLLVDDVPGNLSVLSEALEPEGHRLLVATNGASALRVIGKQRPELILLDVEMPDMTGFDVCRQLQSRAETADIPVIFVTVRDEAESIAEGFEAGGVDYVTKPISPEEVVARVRSHLEIDRLRRELEARNDALAAANERLHQEIEARNAAEAATVEANQKLESLWDAEAEQWRPEGFVGRSAALRNVVADIHKVGASDRVSVLILGESGTGKELVARAIHYGSERHRGPFVAVNCSAIPADLAESVLFGHTKGAFTGAAADHRGHFERASGGTLFLDEIGDMPADLQAKLLRVLEDGVFQPVGGSREISADARIVAATNADLPERMESGEFREDLYYRLARFRISVPPLRERTEDVPLLVDHFLAVAAADVGRPGVRISQAATHALTSYPFPGNIRELRNIVEHAVIQCDSDLVQPHHLSLTAHPESRLPSSPGTPQADHSPTSTPLEIIAQRAEKRSSDLASDEELILSWLREHGEMTNSDCRELLDVSRDRAFYLLKKLVRYGLIVAQGERRWQRYRLTD